MKNQKNITPSQIVGYGVDQIEDELYDYAQDLGIIKNFDKNDFKKRFFYLFIERNHRLVSEYGFIENLFEEAEKGEGESKNFPLHMKQMFLYIFSSLSQDRSKKIDLRFIENLYSFAQNSIRDEDLAKMRSYETSSTSGVGIKDLSENSLKRIFDIANDSEAGINYELLPQTKAGTYVVKTRGKIIDINLYHSVMSDDEVKVTLSELIDAYYDKMSELQKTNPTQDDKINLIGALASDMMKLHPFHNGNGRTFCFGLLNHLLIQEGLTPCMIFNPWHIEHASPEDRTNAIKEGQLAFQKYFINGEKIPEKPKKFKPLTKEVEKMSTLEERAEQMPVQALDQKSIKEIPNLLLIYTQIKTFDSIGRLEDADELRVKLGNKIDALKSTNQLELMKKLGSTNLIFDGDFDLTDSLMNVADIAWDKNLSKDYSKTDFVHDRNFGNIYKAKLTSLLQERFSADNQSDTESNDEYFVAFTFKNIAEFIEKDCAKILKPKSVTHPDASQNLAGKSCDNLK